MNRAWSFEAIGTVWQIEISDLTPQQQTTLHRTIQKRIKLFGQTYSRFINDSLVSAISQAPGQYVMPDDARTMLRFYKKLYDVTKGRVTPLIGRTMEHMGYDKHYSLVQKTAEPSKPPKWDEALSYDHPVLTVKQANVLLDFGAAGKGYLVDIVAGIIRDAGSQDFIINAGGDIWVESGPEEIALEDPLDSTKAIGVTKVSHGAICGSSSSRRQWGNLHHIVDPMTLRPEPTVTATWVMADSCMLADGLATALSFTDPDVLREHFAFEYAMIQSGNIRASKNDHTELFI